MVRESDSETIVRGGFWFQTLPMEIRILAILNLTTKLTTKKMKIIGIITTILITMIVTPVWRGYALSKLWLWFIVSTFGAAPLGIAQSIGLSLIVSFVTHQTDSYEDKDKSYGEKMTRAVLLAFMTPAMALFIGWIVKGFL